MNVLFSHLIECPHDGCEIHILQHVLLRRVSIELLVRIVQLEELYFIFFFHSLTSVMVGDFMMSDDDDRRKHRNSAQGRGAEYYRIADLSSCDRHGFASAAAHPVRCSLKKRSV